MFNSHMKSRTPRVTYQAAVQRITYMYGINSFLIIYWILYISAVFIISIMYVLCVRVHLRAHVFSPSGGFTNGNFQEFFIFFNLII